MTDFAAWMQACQTRIETVLTGLLPKPNISPARLHDIQRTLDECLRRRFRITRPACHESFTSAARILSAFAASTSGFSICPVGGFSGTPACRGST